MHTRTWIVFAAAVTAHAAARADVAITDPMRDDQGWITWDSKAAFTKKGMSVTGVVSRDFKQFPTAFDTSITIDASKAAVWSFGVAGVYTPDAGYTGIGIAANADPAIGVMFARWERGSIIDTVRIDAEIKKIMDGTHHVTISVREGVAYAAIDSREVGKIAYDNHAGSQVVIASFAEHDTYFRDMTIIPRVPSPGTWMIAAAGMVACGRRRR